MSPTVDGKRVWITGASSGIGAELARQLVDRGATVAISARRVDRLEEVSAGRMTVVPLDVTDHDAVLAAAEAVRSEIGELDMVVINAGAWTQTKVGAWDAEAFRTQVETNLLGANSTLAATLPRMIERMTGTIVMMASVAGYRGIPGSEAYGATKAALLNLAESLRADLAPVGVTVQWVSPGFVKTELTDRNDFSMPFLIEADAGRPVDHRRAGIRSRRDRFPFRMAASMKLLQLLPHGLWTRIWKRQSTLRTK